MMQIPINPSITFMFRRPHIAPYSLLIWLRPASFGELLCGVMSHKLSPANVPKAGSVASRAEVMDAAVIGRCTRAVPRSTHPTQGRETRDDAHARARRLNP